jgi:uncharacterized protein (TIGR00369 family)
MSDAPPGFVSVPMGGPFVGINGPFLVGRRDGQVRLGLRIERRHCNTLGMCHGGLLATMADMLMPVAMYEVPPFNGAPRFLPTISLQLDFIAPAQLGDWVEGHAEVLRSTRSLVFAQGLLRAGGRVLLRCSGVYKIAGEVGDGVGMYTHEMGDPAP